MDARDTPPRPAPSLAGAVLSLFSLSQASPSHPRAFFVVQFNTSHLREFEGVSMSTSAECPTTPSRGAGASNPTAQISVHSTPPQPPAQQRVRDADGKPSSAAHAQFIQKEYDAYTIPDVDVLDFIKAVFKFGWEDIPPTPCGGTRGCYVLSASVVRQFLRMPKEVDTYDSICDVSNSLLAQVYGSIDNSEDNSSAEQRRKQIIKRRYKTLGRRAPVRTHRAKVGSRAAEAIGDYHLGEKPDLTFGVEQTRKLNFKWMTVPIEVEKTRVKSAEELSDVLVKGKKGTFIVMDNPGIRKRIADNKAQTGATEAEKGKSKAQKSSDQPAESHRNGGPSSLPAAQTVAGASGASSSTLKRKCESGGWQASTGSNSKKAKTSDAGTPRIINKEAQLLKYINQVMSHNVRSYAIGWLIQNETLRLVYGDRMGIIFTKKIEFLRADANLFLLILAAMGAASVHDLGIHPNVHYPRVDGDALAKCRDVFDVEHGYQGAVLRLEGQGDDGSETQEYEFDVDEKAGRSVYTEFGMIGRGTTVIPVKARGNGSSSSEQESEELVAKVAWPHAARTGEDVFISKVRKCLRREGKTKILDHIVDMKAALAKDSKAMDLPRCAMGLGPDAQDLRVCRILILKSYKPLDTIGSQAEFHQVFVQVVRAHYWAYTTSRVLHRDISMNNIMWFKRGTEIVGVLCDWDLAEDHSNGDYQAVDVGPSNIAAPSDKGKGKGKAISQRRSQRLASRPSNQQSVEQTTATSEAQMQPRYRTGTGPFMAIDLLLENPPPAHKYRHDLESFLYIYICAAATFDPDGQPRIFVVEQWNHPDLKMIGALKKEFLTNTVRYFEIFKHANAEFKVMIDGPLIRLYWLFNQLEHQSIQAQNQLFYRLHVQNTGGKATSNALSSNFDDRRDGVAMYKEFMEILGEVN